MSKTVVKYEGVKNEENTPGRFIGESDLDWTKAQANQIPIINSPVGYGKTHLAVNVLPQHFKSSFPILAEPTKTIKQQTVEDYENAEYFSKLEFLGTDAHDSKVRVACFSAIAQWLKDGNEILEKPDLLILDEIDELAKWTLCFDGYLLAWDWLLSNRKEIQVVGLSATPQLLTDYVRDSPFVSISKDLEPKYKAESVEVITHSSARTYLKTLDYGESNKAIIYLQSAQLCAELAEQYPNAGFLVSEYNADRYKKGEKPLNQLMMEQAIDDFHSPHDNLRDYVLGEKKLPKGYNLLFFNDSCHTGMNLTDENINTVVCETVAQDAIIQAIGRVRHDLEKVVIISNGSKKKPFFEDWERAKRLFNNRNFNNIGFLEGWHASEENNDSDILTYRDSSGTVKVNPFARAVYDYLNDIYEMLDDETTSAQYFESVLCPISSDGKIIYISADEIKKQATNRIRLDESIIAEYMNRDLFGADKKELVERIKLIDNSGNARGWTTLKKSLKQLGYTVRDSQKKNPKTGERERYSVISESGSKNHAKAL